MFRAPSLEPAPDPHGLGDIPIWHAHAICDEQREPRNPLQFESEPCPSGLAHFGDNQMTHVWLTDDVRTGYAMEVPARPLGIFIDGVPKLYEGTAAAAVAGGHDHGGAAGETTYLAVGFCFLIAASAALAVALGMARHPEPAWALAGGLAGMAMVGYVLSRTVGLPQLEDHVGHWDTAGVASLLFESLLVTLSLALVATAGTLRLERS